jgi:hypothetical protein
MKRNCIKCGAQIDKCMGFVLARDFVSKRKIPRELCGKCVLVTKLDELGGLISMSDKDKVEITGFDAAEEWENYVRHEVNTVLNIFLPISNKGNIGIKYVNPVKAQYESGTEYDKNKAIGVEVKLLFKFEEEIDVPEEEEE